MTKSIHFLVEELKNNFDFITKIDAIVWLKERYDTKPSLKECAIAYKIAYDA